MQIYFNIYLYGGGGGILYSVLTNTVILWAMRPLTGLESICRKDLLMCVWGGAGSFIALKLTAFIFTYAEMPFYLTEASVQIAKCRFSFWFIEQFLSL